jgi:hypothetical protein
MSVIMVMRVTADPSAVEAYASANADQLRGITEAAKRGGAIHHTFAGGEGEVLVIDEWPSEAAFQQFFASQPEIPSIMQAVGAQGEPQVSFYRKLDTGDDF